MSNNATASTNNKQDLYVDFENAKKLPFEELQEHLQRLLKDNEFLAEEVAIAESFLVKNGASSIGLGPSTHSVHTDGETDSVATESDGGSVTSGAQQLQTNAIPRRLRGSNAGFGRKKRDSLVAVQLTIENKLDIATREIDEMRSTIDKEHKRFEKRIEDMRAQLKEADLEIEEVDKENYEFQKEIVLGAVVQRTGKIAAEKIVKYLDDKIKLKTSLIDKLILKNSALSAQVKKARQQLEQREEMGESLSKIDFDQLKIENDQLQVKIDERNRDLVHLKLTTGKTIQILTALMDKLNKLNSHTQWLKKQIRQRETNLEALKLEIERAIKEKVNEVKRNSTLHEQQELTKVPSVMEYISVKEELEVVKREVKNWERKLEIVTGTLKILRQKSKAALMASAEMKTTL